MELLTLFPLLIIEEREESLVEEIIEAYISTVVHSFQKGKSPGPDGFTMYFFLGFYYLLKGDLLKVLRESQRSAKILGAMKSTFISLILKKQKGENFKDFCPISCCNMIYKIIAKTIALRLKPFLSTVIS